ncbi:DUF4394 domain-containing protein [Dyadobacter sp. Leaf189]|uniref:DUF4394 domain-containing protein n=1 Tax=Dyadobacter sp. Leaf189 TaxID=1736295 RepID=UPI0006F54097|nr:DUF4394 domain-containing protein [Dyadobacter sp. Leaf189]KQS31020.1 hypothetical protein ASG33_11710 [Dyadobacter sp. Leaf189]
MKILNNSSRRAIAAASLSLLFLSSCEDHRVPPTEQTLPDRIFYALSDNNQLHEINVRSTSSPLRSFNVTGLASGDKLAGIDFRPATGQLYAIGTSSVLYHVNVKTGDQEGKATIVDTLATALSGSSIGFDFNPTVDKIRVVTNTGQNLRLNPETGAILAGDSPLNPGSPKVGAVAYTNSRAGVTAAPGGAGTTLYDIDAEANMLYIQNPPNPGALVPVGPLGLDISEVGGFDISPDMSEADRYPIASVKFENKWELDYVDLKTGKLQKLGDLPAGVNIVGIAIPAMPVAYALDNANNLKIFNPTNGNEYGTKAISGLNGVMLQGIDIRPMNGRLYALGGNSKLYGIDLGSGAATELAMLKDGSNNPVMLSGTQFGVDFNPVADRLRVVSDNGQNLRINVESGLTLVDGALKLDNATPFVTAVAYTNSYPGVTAATAGTTLFDIDSQKDMIYKQNPPNDGILMDGKPLGMDAGSSIGFDIGNFTGMGYAIFTVGGTTSFYTVNPATGATQLKYAFSNPVKGLATGFGL